MAISAPLTGTPRYTVKLTAAAAQDWQLPERGALISVEIEGTPVGVAVSIKVYRNGAWFGGPAKLYQGGRNELFSEVQRMGGVVGWLVNVLFPWVKQALKTFFAGKVEAGEAPAPEPAPAELSAANVIEQINAGLMACKFVDNDGDGIPELVRVI